MTISKELASELDKFGLGASEIAHVRAAGQLLAHAIDAIVDAFYIWLREQPEFATFFGSNSRMVDRVKNMQVEHWRLFFEADLNDKYVASRRHVGAVHQHIDLPTDIYFAGMRETLSAIIRQLRQVAPATAERDAMEAALTRLVFFDTYLATDEIYRVQKEKLLVTSNSLLEMSTPVTPIWDGILLLPLVGIVDSVRTQDIMNKTLAKIAETRARMFVLDISGVSAVDTAVANQLLKITRATQLMGCESIISGISPVIARTLVELGIHVGEVKTTATLRDALELALRAMGMDRSATTSNRSGESR
jgi:rsbT co-antagonist protein RsbR